MHLGILTGGGDCPGLNAVIRAVVKRSAQLDHAVLGIKRGWAGLVEGEASPLTDHAVSGILHKGGTILGTSRTNPFRAEESVQRLEEHWRKFGLDGVIAVGGDDTLGVAAKLAERGFGVVGVPKTIDNDIGATEVTFGFDTACQIVCEAIDRLHTTAEAHHRVMVVEVMGRHTGWIATVAGLAGGADCILIPERPFDLEEVCDVIRKRKERGRNFSIIVVAEGVKPREDSDLVTQDSQVDEFGHVRLGGISTLIAAEIERRTGIETRVTILGHVQRGGTPTAFDRVLATRFGLKAVELADAGQWGTMAALQCGQIVGVPLEEALREIKKVDPELFASAEVFFG
ncbi:MAG: ATP-dependent 6-phosphofructokinase [bacterium]|nr:ATP-dependent 6-phosphofructokinase [bacterium]